VHVRVYVRNMDDHTAACNASEDDAPFTLGAWPLHIVCNFGVWYKVMPVPVRVYSHMGIHVVLR